MVKVLTEDESSSVDHPDKESLANHIVFCFLMAFSVTARQAPEATGPATTILDTEELIPRSSAIDELGGMYGSSDHKN